MIYTVITQIKIDDIIFENNIIERFDFLEKFKEFLLILSSRNELNPILNNIDNEFRNKLAAILN